MSFAGIEGGVLHPSAQRRRFSPGVKRHAGTQTKGPYLVMGRKAPALMIPLQGPSNENSVMTPDFIDNKVKIELRETDGFHSGK